LVTELSPFENYVMLVEMKGRDVLGMAREIVAKRGEPVSGVRIWMSGDEVMMEVGGEPVDPERIYTVATIDYLLYSDKRLFPPGSVVRSQGSGSTQRDALIGFWKAKAARGEQLTNAIDGRILLAK
jgi:hypothetical protein